MAKKEKVEIVRSEEFETVDQELADAMALLDQVNARVIDLLESERPPAVVDGAESAGAPEGERAPDEPPAADTVL